MRADLLIHNIGQLITLAGTPGPRRGEAMRELGIREDAALAVADGRVSAVGRSADLRATVQAHAGVDAGGRAVIPGFVDPHTHLPWAGHRVAEFEMRIGGATYMEIMAAGGGIVRTVSATRAASLEALVAETREPPGPHAGLRHDDGRGQDRLRADARTSSSSSMRLRHCSEQHPIDLVPTFLGAHAVPVEYRGRADAYVDLVVDEMLPAAWARWVELRADFGDEWPIFCDVFCEHGAFDLAQTRRILEAAQALGFRLKLHVDEFEPLGGHAAGGGAGRGVGRPHRHHTARSTSRCSPRRRPSAWRCPARRSGWRSGTTRPAAALIDDGGALALATDLNPGTTWCESMQMMMALACRYMRLLPAEALTAATLNAAYAAGLGHRVGSLEPGKLADLIVLDADDYRMLGYRYGTNLARTVIKRGVIVRGDDGGERVAR